MRIYSVYQTHAQWECVFCVGKRIASVTVTVWRRLVVLAMSAGYHVVYLSPVPRMIVYGWYWYLCVRRWKERNQGRLGMRNRVRARN